MRRILVLVVLLVLCGGVQLAAQQEANPERGDPPVAALINISEPDEDGIVTISGGAGAVFPTAQVVIRNLFTQETVTAFAGLTGSFSAEIFGPGNMPFWISPATSIPRGFSGQPVALPGGPGTIVYGSFSESLTRTPPATQIIIDGQTEDWSAYPEAELREGIQAFFNQDSLYLATNQTLESDQQLVLTLEIDPATYEVQLDPSLPQTALLRQTEPTERDLGTIAVAAVTGDAIELRLGLSPISSNRDTITLDQVSIYAGDTFVDATVLLAELPFFDEQDGIVYPGGRLQGRGITQFSVAGPIAQGASHWSAIGRVDSLTPSPGDEVTLELDVTLDTPDLAESLVGLKLIGEITLQPVVLGGNHNVAALHTNNGWSNVLTPSGLAIDNLRGDIHLGGVMIPAEQVVRRGDQLLAGFRFQLTIPDDLPQGIYVPTFKGLGQIADGEIFAWSDTGVLGSGDGIARLPLTRLPLILNVGVVQENHLYWTLLFDHPSDGSRGILPEEDQGSVALSNRVRFNSPTYVLPPGQYPIEPYLLNEMPNAYDITTSPLLPLLLPGGRLNATITWPDGTMDTLPDVPIVQNRLSTALVDDRALFGAQSPLDSYRLTTGNTAYRDYTFDQYGEYEITLSGFVEDIYGNRFDGGGTYHLLIAEPLDLTPGVLPGTPFQIGDTFFAGGHITPGVAADVTVNLALYEVETGDVVHQSFDDIQADSHGYFAPEDMYHFDADGEYVIDYEVRYEDEEDRLWAASLRSAGVVAEASTDYIAHGRRGIDSYVTAFPDDYDPSWFDTQQYPPDELVQTDPLLNYPYFNGDIAVIDDSPTSGIRPALHLQDLSGVYRDWLLGTVPDHVSGTGLALSDLAAIAELPVIPVLAGPEKDYEVALKPDFVVSDAYSYFSAVRPDVTVRQFVLGDDDPALALYWNGDDPLNDQIGTGAHGLQPGDYVFLFGGVVIRNQDLDLRITAPYAALAIVGDDDESPRIVPPYRGAAGGPDGGALFVVQGEEAALFFHPTGVIPGQVLEVGEPFAFAGQAAPTLRSRLEVVITAPDGNERHFVGSTNDTGYYFNPDDTFALDLTGVWTVKVVVTPAGVTSAGIPEAPLPEGTVPGATDQTFNIYVVPEDAEPLAWSQADIVDTSFHPGIPFNLGLDIPTDWTEVRAFNTIATPSYILQQGSLNRQGSVISYQFSPSQLAAIFPNFETNGEGDGPSGSDVVTLTFAITGLDAQGDPVIRSRTITIMHDRLISRN